MSGYFILYACLSLVMRLWYEKERSQIVPEFHHGERVRIRPIKQNIQHQIKINIRGGTVC
jgi:hypothetical protein